MDTKGSLHSQTSFSSLSDTSRSERVPQTLQTVLIVANRGKEVTKAPPDHVASRSFRRWFGLGYSKTNKRSAPQSSQKRQVPAEVPTMASPRTVMRKSASTATVVSSTPITKHHVSPQQYLTSLLKTRGYSTSTFRSVDTAYYNKPTPLQVASYGVRITEVVRKNDVNRLREMLRVGLSPNACNEHGESLVHMVCRTCKKDCLEVLLEYGCTIQVVDDYGRSPVHDACWSANTDFELVTMLLELDPRLLFMEDARGALPLSYLREEEWTVWTKFLMSVKDKFWPERDLVKVGVEADPPLTLDGPNTKPIPDPKDALQLELARLVAQGRMEAAEAALLKAEDDDEESTEDDSFTSSSEFEGEDSDEDDDCDSDDEDDEDEDDDSIFDDTEMMEILGSFGRGQAIAWST